MRASSVTRKRDNESEGKRTTREVKASNPISQELKQGEKPPELREGKKHDLPELHKGEKR